MNQVQTFQGPSYWPDIPGGFQNIIKGSSLISQVRTDGENIRTFVPSWKDNSL
jgi:hypothetical protein